SRELGIPLTTLYPFKASFYHSFGYGYGVPVYNYKSAPADFKDYGIREGLSYLDSFTFDPLEACYNKFVEDNHGMMFKSTTDKYKIERMKEGRILVYKEKGEITGFYHILRGIEYVPDPIHLPLISHKLNDTSLGMMYMALDPAELIEWVEDRVEENLVFNIIHPKHKDLDQMVESFEINPGHLEKLELDMSLQSFTSWIMGAV
ncbi:GNAT family N-acetyltransferase, partial [Aduncisulcus paluster]